MRFDEDDLLLLKDLVDCTFRIANSIKNRET